MLVMFRIVILHYHISIQLTLSRTVLYILGYETNKKFFKHFWNICINFALVASSYLRSEIVFLNNLLDLIGYVAVFSVEITKSNATFLREADKNSFVRLLSRTVAKK